MNLKESGQKRSADLDSTAIPILTLVGEDVGAEMDEYTGEAVMLCVQRASWTEIGLANRCEWDGLCYTVTSEQYHIFLPELNF